MEMVFSIMLMEKKYVGNWINDKINGPGVVTWPNGDRYEGNFIDGDMNGNGIFYYADGKKYVGNLVKRKLDKQTKTLNFL